MLDLGSITSGFTGGMDGGLDLMAKQRAMQEQARTQAAQRAIAQGQINAAGQPPGGMMQAPVPGAQPMPGAPGQPGPMPTGMGASPLPQGGPPGMGGPPGGGGSLMGVPMGRTGMAPGFMGMPGPQAAMGGAPGGAPGPQAAVGGGAPPQQPRPQVPQFSGAVQSTGDLGQDSQGTINRIFQELIKQNPDLKKDPQTLFAAAQQQIELMKGVNSDLRTMMQTQLGYARLGEQKDALQARIDNWEKMHKDRVAAIDERLKATNLTNAERTFLGKLRAQTELEATRMRVSATERGQDLSYGAREDAIDAAGDRTEATLGERGRESDNNQDTQRARIQAGGMPTDKAAPALRQRKPTQLPRRQRTVGPGRAAAISPSGQSVTGQPPPYDPAKYKNHTTVGPDGTVWASDGRSWNIQQAAK